MKIASHWLISWLLGEAGRLPDARCRRIVTAAGMLPDIDALAYAAGIVATGGSFRHGYLWFQAAHHRYTHGLGFALLTGLGAWLLARRGGPEPGLARRVGLLAAAASLLHGLCDVIGSGAGWGIYPLFPASAWKWGADWSWPLSSWQNNLVLLGLLALSWHWGRTRNRTPLEALSPRLDRRVIASFRAVCGWRGARHPG